MYTQSELGVQQGRAIIRGLLAYLLVDTALRKVHNIFEARLSMRRTREATYVSHSDHLSGCPA